MFYSDDVSKIIDYVLRGAGKHQAITLLADMTDKFGPRGTGTQALEDSIGQYIRFINYVLPENDPIEHLM